MTRAKVLEMAAQASPVTADGAENFTDTGNARRLARLHGDDLLHCHPWRRWLVYGGGRWALDETGEVMRRAQATASALLIQASNAIGEEREKLTRHALSLESDRNLRAMISLAAAQPGIPVRPEDLDAAPWMLNVANGIIDLRTGELLPHDRAALLTKLAPVEFDPSATAPLWKAHLERVLPDPEVRAFLQRAVGYSLTGVTTEQVLFLMWGGGANGKSVTTEAIFEVLGDYALKTPAETLLARRGDSIPNDIARLRGARFVSAVELEEGRRLAESRVKELTGGDTVSARFMRAEYFDFRPVCKLWISTNHKPAVRGTDEAIWRRLRLIDFTVTIPEPERDLRLQEKLRSELPGILAWAVEGCLAWQQGGLRAPAAVLMATATYREDQDVLGAFLEERCVLGAGHWTFTDALYQAYREWTEANGERAISQKALATRLAERGCSSDRKGHGGRRTWHGIGLLKGDG